MSKRPVCYNYAILNTHTGRIKLGRSQDPDRRLKTLQTGNDEKLEILYRRVFKNCVKAENALHQVFGAYRKRGEFFQLSLAEKEILQRIFTGRYINEVERLALERLQLI